MSNVAQLPQIDDDLYRHARAEYADRYANLAAGKRNWQFAVLGFFLVAIMTSAIAIIQVRKPAEVPFVVALDRSDGYAITFPTPPTASGTAIDLNQVEEETVAAFIRSARAVIADVKGEDALLNFVKQHAKGNADRFLGDYFTSWQHRPYLISRDHSVSPTIASLIGVGPHSWQVRWTETRFDRLGHEIPGQKPEHWIALLHCTVNPKEGRLALIIQSVEIQFRFERGTLLGRRRTQRIAMTRQLAMFLCRSLTSASYPNIAAAFGRDHSTCLHNCDLIRGRMARDTAFRSFVQRLERQIDATAVTTRAAA